MDMKKGTYKKAMYYNGTTEVRKKMTHLNITFYSQRNFGLCLFSDVSLCRETIIDAHTQKKNLINSPKYIHVTVL